MGALLQPVLYSFRRCPYAMRARLALAVSGQPCRLREVVLRDKPQAMLMASPKGTVPVLVDTDGRVIDESLDIMLWALRQNDPQRWLQPENESLSGALELVADCDRTFKFHLDRYKYPQRYEGLDPDEHWHAGIDWLVGLELRLGNAAGLSADRFTLSDAAIAPFVRQFARADLARFEGQNLPGVQRWLNAFLASDLFTGVMHKYAPWQEGAPDEPFPPPGLFHAGNNG